MPGFHYSVTVLPLPLRKFRKNYVIAVLRCLREKNPLRRCRFHLPLRRNYRSVAIGSNPIFAVQRSGHVIPMYTERRFQHFRSHPQRQR